MRFEDMQQDLHRSQSDIQNLLSQNNALQQDNDRYMDMVSDKDRQIGDLLKGIEEKGQALTEKGQLIEEMQSRIGDLESQIREKEMQIQREKASVSSLVESEAALTEFLRQAKGELLRQKEHLAVLQTQLQNAPPGAARVDAVTKDETVDPRQLLDNSIAADFINMLTEATGGAGSGGDGPTPLASLTLEEIENAESNR